MLMETNERASSREKRKAYFLILILPKKRQGTKLLKTQEIIDREIAPRQTNRQHHYMTTAIPRQSKPDSLAAVCTLESDARPGRYTVPPLKSLQLEVFIALHIKQRHETWERTYSADPTEGQINDFRYWERPVDLRAIFFPSVSLSLICLFLPAVSPHADFRTILYSLSIFFLGARNPRNAGTKDLHTSS